MRFPTFAAEAKRLSRSDTASVNDDRDSDTFSVDTLGPDDGVSDAEMVSEHRMPKSDPTPVECQERSGKWPCDSKPIGNVGFFFGNWGNVGEDNPMRLVMEAGIRKTLP